jgi:hypothetical protein
MARSEPMKTAMDTQVEVEEFKLGATVDQKGQLKMTRLPQVVRVTTPDGVITIKAVIDTSGDPILEFALDL